MRYFYKKESNLQVSLRESHIQYRKAMNGQTDILDKISQTIPRAIQET